MVNLECQGRGGIHFPTGASQVYDFDVIGVKLLWRHGEGSWCQMNPDSEWLKKVEPRLPLSRKLSYGLVFNLFIIHPING